MIYKTFQDVKLSALGLGAMRLPVTGEHSAIDQAAAGEMIAYAMAHGINYYDTAWGYHNGTSETVLGKLLSAYPRESYYLATKFPGYDLDNMDKAATIFEEQLNRCRVSFFDFYLFHNVCELNVDAYLDPQYGILDYLLEQKAQGRIRHLGFSVHGGLDVMKRFLEAYGRHMEFCQIQLNYLDWTFQDAAEKVRLLEDARIPVWVMEPLRGGRLATLPEAEAKALAALRPDETVPGWAFRFLQSLPSVTMVLSGMSNLAQLQQNIRTFETDAPLTPRETEALLQVADSLLKEKTVPCTACGYCTDYCPQGLDIPWLIRLYNEHLYTGGGFLTPRTLQATPAERRPSACLGCRSCEAVCPQQIEITKAMAALTEATKE